MAWDGLEGGTQKNSLWVTKGNIVHTGAGEDSE